MGPLRIIIIMFYFLFSRIKIRNTFCNYNALPFVNLCIIQFQNIILAHITTFKICDYAVCDVTKNPNDSY